MLTPELIDLASAPSRGPRPQFGDDPLLERLFGVTVALVAELAVARERLDSLERILQRRALVEAGELDRFVPEEAAALERQQWHQEYLARIFRVLLQDAGAAQGGHAT